MDPQRILTDAIAVIQADRSMSTFSSIIHAEMLFAAKRHIRDARFRMLREARAVSISAPKGNG